MPLDGFGSFESGDNGTATGGAGPERGFRMRLNSLTGVECPATRVPAAVGEIGPAAQCGHVPLGHYNDPRETAGTFPRQVAGCPVTVPAFENYSVRTADGVRSRAVAVGRPVTREPGAFPVPLVARPRATRGRTTRCRTSRLPDCRTAKRCRTAAASGPTAPQSRVLGPGGTDGGVRTPVPRGP
jgi:hypothetical protein